jgi:hypothetical protein
MEEQTNLQSKSRLRQRKINKKKESLVDEAVVEEKKTSMTYIEKRNNREEIRHKFEIARLSSEINVNLLKANLLTKEHAGNLHTFIYKYLLHYFLIYFMN